MYKYLIDISPYFRLAQKGCWNVWYTKQKDPSCQKTKTWWNASINDFFKISNKAKNTKDMNYRQSIVLMLRWQECVCQNRDVDDEWDQNTLTSVQPSAFGSPQQSQQSAMNPTGQLQSGAFQIPQMAAMGGNIGPAAKTPKTYAGQFLSHSARYTDYIAFCRK